MTTRRLPLLAVLLLAGCTHTPPVTPPVVPPVTTCPSGQHAVDGVCVPDVVPPPLTCPAGQHIEAGDCVPDAPPPAAMPAQRLLLHAVGPDLFYADGIRFEFREVVYCCAETFGSGWPGVSRDAIDKCLRLGRCTLVHQRVGPFVSGNEPIEYPAGGGYAEVGGKADLDRWNEPYWTAQAEVIRYAGLHGVVVERVIVDDWGVANESWASGDAPAAWYPWASQGNVQGEAAHVEGTVGPREEVFIRKNVATSCGFSNVVYQLGQEEKNVSGYTYEGVTKRRAAIVRDEEQKRGCPAHLLSQSSEKDESFRAPETQWTVLHGYLPDEPFEERVTSNNECCNGDGLTGPQIAAAWCRAEANGSHVAIWRGTMDAANFTYAQGRMSQGLAGCAPHDMAGCSIDPPTVGRIDYKHFSGPLWDGTPKQANGRPILEEGALDRPRCEALACGTPERGICSPTFTLVNATGTLAISQRPGNPVQFVTSGHGTGEVRCTTPASGDANLCRAESGGPLIVSVP